MSRSNKRGKVVHKEFLKYRDFHGTKAFEEAIEERVRFLRKATEIYTDGIVGMVKVFRNRVGARILAYDVKKES